MADASRRDLSQFFRWYEQAGTPVLSVDGKYDVKAQVFRLSVSQNVKRLKSQTAKSALHMPLGIGLVGPNGKDMKLTGHKRHIELSKSKQNYVFKNIKSRPVLSINRGFSAPVIVRQKISRQDQLFLLAHDSDSFNRWEAAQVLARDLIVLAYRKGISKPWVQQVSAFSAALRNCVSNIDLDDAYKVKLLQFPSFSDLMPFAGKDIDSDKLYSARQVFRQAVARHLLEDLKRIFAAAVVRGPYSPSAAPAGKRALREAALSLAGEADANWAAAMARTDFDAAENMTIEFNALEIGAALPGADASKLLNDFYNRHHTDHLLIDKWFRVQAMLPSNDAAKKVRALMAHKDFSLKTPNRVYALLRNFIGGNMLGFNASDGAGYILAGDAILALDKINPQVASRLAVGFRSWRMFDLKRRKHAEKQLRRIVKTNGLSPDVYEIISRTLKS